MLRRPGGGTTSCRLVRLVPGGSVASEHTASTPESYVDSSANSCRHPPEGWHYGHWAYGPSDGSVRRSWLGGLGAAPIGPEAPEPAGYGSTGVATRWRPSSACSGTVPTIRAWLPLTPGSGRIRTNRTPNVRLPPQSSAAREGYERGQRH